MLSFPPHVYWLLIFSFHLYFFVCLCLSGRLCPLLGFVWTPDAFATPAAATEASAAAAEGGASATSAPAANAGAGGWQTVCLCVRLFVYVSLSQWWKETKHMCTVRVQSTYNWNNSTLQYRNNTVSLFLLFSSSGEDADFLLENCLLKDALCNF